MLLLAALSFLMQEEREPFAGVPFFDLSSRSELQTIVDREPGQYLGHPTTVLLADGQTILCVYPKGHGNGSIVLKRSEDGASSWSARQIVPENWATSQETPTIHRVRSLTGGERLLLFSGLNPIRMARSEDEGRTWSPLAKIGDWGGIVAMASLTQLENGILLAWFHDDGRFIANASLQPDDGAKFHVYQTRSTDGGLSWEPPHAIASHPEAQLCEPGLARSPDGKTLALLLRENSRKFHSFIIFSEDEGASWSDPRETSLALTGDRHVTKYAPDGRLFVSFRDTAPGSPTAGDWCVWIGAWQDLVDGTPGARRIRLMDNLHQWDCAYPSLELLPDGTFIATTYGHWIAGESPFIVSLRLKPELLSK